MNVHRNASGFGLRQKLIELLEFTIEQTQPGSDKPKFPFLRNNVPIELSWIDKESADPVIARLRETAGVLSITDKSNPCEICVRVTAPFETWKNLLQGGEPIIPFSTMMVFSSASTPMLMSDLMHNKRRFAWTDRFSSRVRTRHHGRSAFSHMKIG